MTIEVEQLMNATIEEVWRALTNPAEMQEWYFDSIQDFKAEVGFTTVVTMQSTTELFTAHWEVVAVVPASSITYTWAFEGYDGLGEVTFELEKQGDQTLVKVIDKDLKPWPQDVPEFTPESCRDGWEYFIQQQLPNFLSKT